MDHGRRRSVAAKMVRPGADEGRLGRFLGDLGTDAAASETHPLRNHGRPPDRGRRGDVGFGRRQADGAHASLVARGNQPDRQPGRAQRRSASHSHGQPATETDSPPRCFPRPAGRGGRFSLDPARQVAQGATAALRVSTPEKPDPWQAFPWGAIRDRRKQTSDPDAWQAWVWDCQLQSWYQVDGPIRHQAALDLHNAVHRGLTFSVCLSPERTCEAFPSTVIPWPGAGRPATVPACWESICP